MYGLFLKQMLLFSSVVKSEHHAVIILSFEERIETNLIIIFHLLLTK